ncbi:MAG: acylneuraminate cytidylyltransferase [Gammaproteobacteria bacterium]|nr:MAG: acylneuraminate cytidylyltransferase [Gammaproteobacteria bacterium]
MTVICITQARMNSSRLPGKILKKINAIPLIEYHCVRVARSQKVDLHIIATTNSEMDKACVDYCESKNLNYFCGSEKDVLERFYMAAKTFGAANEDLIVRLTADCPLIAPELIDAVITAHQKKQSKTYSRLSLEHFPRGFDVEVFSMSTLRQAYEKSSSEFEREHVTPFMYKPEFSKSVQTITIGDKKWADIRLCVDQLEDFKLLEQLLLHYKNDWQDVKYTAICQYMLANPELMSINAKVQQK